MQNHSFEFWGTKSNLELKKKKKKKTRLECFQNTLTKKGKISPRSRPYLREI